MLIPNTNKAIVDIRKLRHYCLNLEYDDGKHKARLFSLMLGMKAENADELRASLKIGLDIARDLRNWDRSII